MNGNKKINILDCTLRDGSYVIDYQFTVEDTYVICLGLARCGFKYIEIGHGLGMGSSLKRKGHAAANDKEYLQAAKAALSGFDSKYGMFFIPGIGSLEDLQLAADCEIDFVRIGTNVNEIDKAAPYIRKAKDLGLMVTSNLMKSYAVNIDEFKDYGKMANDFGVDVIYVVDSAGSMMPGNVRKYIEALKSVTSKDIGFHGHNNLQLAIANTLAAVEAGAVFVDSSLQGMGRSAGNTQTEVLVMLLEKLGHVTGIDPYGTMDMGQRIVKTMMSKEQGIDDISLVSGIAQFHSGFMDIIDEMAERYQVDPRLLMMEVSKVEKINVKRKLVEETARTIAFRCKQKQVLQPEIMVNKSVVFRKIFENTMDQTKAFLQEMTGLANKTGKKSVFSLTLSKSPKATKTFIRQSHSLVIANMEVRSLQEAETLLADIDGQVDWVLLDENCLLLRKNALEAKINKSCYAWYCENRVLLSSLCAFLSQRPIKGSVLIFADQVTGELLSLLLGQQGLQAVRVLDKSSFKKCIKECGIAVLVSFGEEFCSFLDAGSVRGINKDVMICCARPGTFPSDFWKEILKTEMTVCRVDGRAALASELSLAIETSKYNSMMGTRVLDGVQAVSGGIIGTKGSVILDTVFRPGKVIGICDGIGGVLSSQEEIPYRENMEKIRAWIIENLYK